MLLLIVWERLQLSGQFTVNREIAAHVPLGEKTYYRLSLTNLGRQTLKLDSQPDYPDSISAESILQRWTIPMGQSQTKEYIITPVALGTTSLGKLYARNLGKFGLVWWTHHFTEPDQVKFKVEPAGLTHNQALPGQVRSGGRKTRYKPGSGFELLALRDYQYGDSQRSIDWKASAKRQRPMVRIFSQEQRLEIAILIDCGRASHIQCGVMDRLHHYVNIASRLADFAVRHDDQISCIAYADNILASVPMTGGSPAIKKSRNLLGGLSAISEESNPLAVALELKNYLKHRSLIIFLSEIEQAEAATQLLQAVHLLRKKHHILIASIDDPAIANLTREKAYHWLAPYQNFAALEYIRGRELTRNKLRQAGVAIISAPAEKLDREVLNYYQQLRERREV
jgi:uncharacterized protein (DUF58 family)